MGERRLYRFECQGQDLAQLVASLSSHHVEGVDQSWLEAAPEGAPSMCFWTQAGLEAYERSGLKHAHLSMVSAATQLVIAEHPPLCKFETKHQVWLSPEEAKIVRRYHFDYQGPRPFVAVEDLRPACLRHHDTVRDYCEYAPYPQSDETFSYGAALGAALGLARVAINHEILRPGKRTSWPHAHKVEEEAVYVLRGMPDIWINGELHSAKPGDFYLFPPDSGYAHTILNRTDEDIHLLVLGEQDAEPDWIYYPLHPERDAECRSKGWYWEDHPQLELGAHQATAAELVSEEPPRPYPFCTSLEAAPLERCGAPDAEDRVYYLDHDLARTVGCKRLAFHHVTLDSGHRTSLPHAESLEEEAVYVLKGRVEVWINGERHQLVEGDCVAFAAGTGVAHSILNPFDEPAALAVMGELTKHDNRCAFPLNPEMAEISGIFWPDAPAQRLGAASPLP